MKHSRSFAFFFASIVSALTIDVQIAAADDSRADLIAHSSFAGYHSNEGFPVSAINWSKYTHISYTFAETTEDGGLSLDGSNADQLPVFVSAAKENNVKSLITIGGWGGSRFFSSSCATAENRTAFVQTVLDFVKEYHLDGVEFSWLYPNRQGLGCNTISANDTSNYLEFLQDLSQNPASDDLIITVTGSLFPWLDSNGLQSTNLTGFVDVLDWLTVLNYDVYGPWANTGGPNAPIDGSCDRRNNQGSAEAAIAAWTAAGIPANKLAIAVPAYGHGFRVNRTNAFEEDGTLSSYPIFNASDRFQGSVWDDASAEPDVCGVLNPPGGLYTFWSLIDAGFLDRDGHPADGISYTYDNCSQTPAVYNETSAIWVSFDDARSFQAKGEYIKEKSLRGFSLWETGGDSNDILVDAILSTVD